MLAAFLEPKRGANLGTVHRFVTTGGPASAATEPSAMVRASDQYPSTARLLLEMALEAEHGIALGQHLRVYRPMRFVAGRAPFAHSFMLEYEGTSLCNMALTAGLLLA